MRWIKLSALNPSFPGPERIVPALALRFKWDQKFKLGKISSNDTLRQQLLVGAERLKDPPPTLGLADPRLEKNRFA